MNTIEQPANGFEGWPIIHSHTRAQAIADGALVDVSELAREQGFMRHTAMTAAAWEDAVAWDRTNGEWQDETGRLWDVFTMARAYMRGAVNRDAEAREFLFQLVRIPNKQGARRATKCILKCHIGPGDNAEPVFTIMRPDED